MEDSSYAELLEEIRAMRHEIAELKASSAKFEKLHSAGKVALVVILGFGSLVSFGLLVANQIKGLVHP